jgi:ubiquinone/menaquinone biosynthesis C-methylase UbiE
MRRRILAPLKQKTASLAAHLETPRDLRILDVACGTGRTLKGLRSTFPEASLFGVDLSPTYLRKANQLLCAQPGELPQLLQGNAEALPYRDAFFHAVTCVFLFHELPSPVRQNVLNEMFRVLQPGGVVAICDSIQVEDDPDLKPALENFQTLFHEPYYRDYIQDDLPAKLQKAGFTSVSTYSYFMSKYWVAHKKATTMA